MNKKDIKLIEEAYTKVTEGLEDLKTPEGVIAGSEDGAALAGNIRAPQEKLGFLRGAIKAELKRISGIDPEKLSLLPRVLNMHSLDEINNITDYNALRNVLLDIREVRKRITKAM